MILPCAAQLLQLRVFLFRLLVDGNIGAGVFPERKEVLVGGAGPDLVSLKNTGAGKVKAGQRPPREVN